VVPITGEVLKPNAPVSRNTEPLSTHSIDQISESGEPVFGCPMLTRTKLQLPFAGNRKAPRCALGWSVHSEQEAGYCLMTPDHLLCWKVHPERIAELEGRSTKAAAAD